MLIAPNGDIYFNEAFDASVSRFDGSRADDPACLTLDAQGQNPCIESRVIPNFDLVNQAVHSIALDGEGRLWFTTRDAREEGAENTASVGFVTAGFGAAVLFPPLEAFPGDGAAHNTGIAFDPATGDVWFAEFLRKRIGRLQRVF
jgi:hypothetical protein